MSTVLDIDKELVAQAEAAAKARGIGLREFVAGALRQALNNPGVAAPARFVQRVHDFGVHVESPWAALAEIELEQIAVGNNTKK